MQIKVSSKLYDVVTAKIFINYLSLSSSPKISILLKIVTTPLKIIRKTKIAVNISLGKIIAAIANTKKPMGAIVLKFIIYSYIVKN